jgi:hypothetical protein
MMLREATAADIPTLVAVVHAAFGEYRDRLEPPQGHTTKLLSQFSERSTPVGPA